MKLHRYAIATAVMTFFLLIAGGLVSTTESGLACPDWPLCEGQYIPRMINGKQFEHTHRLVAAFVATMTFGLCALLLKYRRRDRLLTLLGAGAAALVVVQALLGALTVKLKLPAWVSASHLATAMAFFSVMVSAAFLTYQRGPGVRARGLPEETARSTSRWILATALLTYVQIVAGAVMRHTRAGLACGFDFPLCLGKVWPVAGAYAGVHIHMVHRALGMVDGVAVIALAIFLWRRAREARALRGLAVALAVGVVLQVWLGIGTIAMSRDLAMMTAHSSLGALLLAGLWSAFWMVRPSFIPSPAVSLSNRGGMNRFSDYVSLTKPRLSSLVIITAAGGMWLAPGALGLSRTIAVLLAITGTVGAANALNCYLERDSDRFMKRTRNRPLPAGRMDPRRALWFGIGLGSLPLPLLAAASNLLTALLGAVALVSYVMVYTPLKARSSLAMLVGALPGALPPLMGWTAVTGRLDVKGGVLFALLFLWQLPHFIAISLFRKDEYAAAGLKLIPLEKGDAASRMQAVIYLALLAPVAVLPYSLKMAGTLYLVVSVLLTAAFVGHGLFGAVLKLGKPWARQLFFLSLIHLTGLFAALMIDSAPPISPEAGVGMKAELRELPGRAQ